MFDIKDLNKAIEQLAIEKDLDVVQIRGAVEAALASAYKKEFERRGEIISTTLDPKTGEAQFFQVKSVVDKNSVRFVSEEEYNKDLSDKAHKKFDSKKDIKDSDDEEEYLPVYNEQRHILIEDALKIKKDAVVDDEIKFPLPSHDGEFGRIAAQTAKQVILQKIREIEKNIIKNEFEGMVGSLVSGVVQRIERGSVYADLGKASGIMSFSEAVPGEHYRVGERLRFYLLDVQDSGRAPVLLLSRANSQFVMKLFELEVPEIADGIVTIKNIVREPGNRTKIAVTSTVEGVDPIGSCVGQRGSRIMAINGELFNERIDIVEWSEDMSEYIASALAPAEISSVDLVSMNNAIVFAPENQLSLAIGKGGQNVRLAAKLTGWKIDVRSQSRPDEVQDGGIADSFEKTIKKNEDDKGLKEEASDGKNNETTEIKNADEQTLKGGGDEEAEGITEDKNKKDDKIEELEDAPSEDLETENNDKQTADKSVESKDKETKGDTDKK